MTSEELAQWQRQKEDQQIAQLRRLSGSDHASPEGVINTMDPYTSQQVIDMPWLSGGGRPERPVASDGLGLSVQQPPADNPMRGWDSDPSQGGLGLASNANSGTPSQGQPGGSLAELRFKQLHPEGDFSKLGTMERWQLGSPVGAQLAEQASQQREAMALRLQQADESKRQHDLQVMEKLIAAGEYDGLVEHGKKFGPSKLIADSLGKQDIGKLPLYLERGYITKEEADIVTHPEKYPASERLTPGQLHARFKIADKAYTQDVEEEAKTNQLDRALEAQRSGVPLRPFQVSLLKDHATKQALADAELAIKQGKASGDGVGELKMNDLIGKERTRDILTSGGHNPMTVAKAAMSGDVSAQALLGKARAQADKEEQVNEQFKALGRGTGTMDVPVGTEANLYRRLLPDGTSEGIRDVSIGKLEAGKQGYRDTAKFKESLERADKAKSALRLLGDLETYSDAIITAQNGPIDTVLQGWKLSLQGVTKTGALTKIPGQNGKPLTVGEVASLYNAKSEQIADQLARGGGMVGTATENDTMRSLMGLAGKYDTANVAKEKYRTFKKSFGGNILQEFEQAYGREAVPETLRSHLRQGELPSVDKMPARQFLKNQEKIYRDKGYKDDEIKSLLKRDFNDMGYE